MNIELQDAIKQTHIEIDHFNGSLYTETSQLRLTRDKQKFIYRKSGISSINNADCFNTSRKADVFVYVSLIF